MELRTIVPPGTATPSPGGGEGRKEEGGKGGERREGAGSIYVQQELLAEERHDASTHHTEGLAHLRW